MNEETLCNLYEIASRKPGWLSKLETVFQLTPEEIGFLDWLDIQETKVNAKIRAMEAQMRREGFDEALIDCETDDESMAVLNKLIFTLEDQHNDLRKVDKPYLDRALFLLVHRYEHWIKLRNTIRRKMIPRFTASNGVTDSEIETARHVPFDLFCEPMKHFIHCLWHEDKHASMSVKNGFGWCYSCNEWCDPIKWWMKHNGRDFVESVRALNQLHG